MALLIELSADGIVTRSEMDQLRSWLEVDRGLDFPALAFLYQVIDEISGDGELTEEELDRPPLRLSACFRRMSARRRHSDNATS
jgi:hypothetical protein